MASRLPTPVRYPLACAGLFAAYALVPVRADAEPLMLVLRSVLTLALLVLVVLFIGRQAMRQLREADAPVEALVVGIVAGLLLFALIDYTVAVHGPGQFTGLETRVDALYFALSTLLTVGFGDVSAQGQAARAVLCAQMAFNVTAIAGSASLVARRLTARAARRTRRGSGTR